MTEFGTTAWGRDWLRLAEPLTITRPVPALPKARSLARNDRVHRVEHRPGLVRASVLDRTERQVTITLSTWDSSAIGTARRLLAASAGPDLPDTVHSALAGAGLEPVPATVRGDCDCGGRQTPCAHLLAVYFELARRLDEQPRTALVLRGLTDHGSTPPMARIPLAMVDPAGFYDRRA